MSDGSNGVNGEQIRAFIDRVEATEANIRVEQENRKEIYTEAKSFGFDPKIIRRIVALRKMDNAKREEEQAILELYLNALGQGDLFA